MPVTAEPETLLAGRELDLLIAEKVMNDWQDEEGWWCSADGSRISCADGGPQPYSTDIKAAWDVVETLQARGYPICLIPHLKGQVKQGYTASINYHFTRDYEDIEETAETAPLAICRAALKAVEAAS